MSENTQLEINEFIEYIKTRGFERWTGKKGVYYRHNVQTNMVLWFDDITLFVGHKEKRKPTIVTGIIRDKYRDNFATFFKLSTGKAINMYGKNNLQKAFEDLSKATSVTTGEITTSKCIIAKGFNEACTIKEEDLESVMKANDILRERQAYSIETIEKQRKIIKSIKDELQKCAHNRDVYKAKSEADSLKLKNYEAALNIKRKEITTLRDRINNLEFIIKTYEVALHNKDQEIKKMNGPIVCDLKALDKNIEFHETLNKSSSSKDNIDKIIDMLEKDLLADDYNIQSRNDVLNLMKAQFERTVLLINEIKKLKVNDR